MYISPISSGAKYMKEQYPSLLEEMSCEPLDDHVRSVSVQWWMFFTIARGN